MKKSRVVVFLMVIALAPTIHARRVLDPDNCLSDLKARSHNASYGELTELARTLTKRDLKCLFHEASNNGPPSMDFFTPMPNGFEKRVAIIFGKNSMPFMNTFEKHIFSTRSLLRDADDRTEELFGYNFHGAITVTGPGFFKVKPNESSTCIDFTDDFMSEIASDDIVGIQGVKAVTTRNNHGNVFFGGDTKDYCVRLLYDDVLERDIAVVCEGYRNFFGHRRAFIWDILIRQWDSEQT